MLKPRNDGSVGHPENVIVSSSLKKKKKKTKNKIFPYKHNDDNDIGGEKKTKQKTSSFHIRHNNNCDDTLRG